MTVLIDPSVLGQYRDVMGADGDEFIKDVVQTFLTDAEKLTQEMARALENGDRETFQRGAHTLKTSVATIGAKALSERFKAMELNARSLGLVDLEADLVVAYRELRSVSDELRVLFLE